MSELRQDLVSGDWIVIAPSRRARPHGVISRAKRKREPKDMCPFENLMVSGNWPPIADDGKREKWQMVIIPNKYPALRHSAQCAETLAIGPYTATEGVGAHELLISRDHDRHIGMLKASEAVELFTFLQDHYRILRNDPCYFYTSTFFNWGQMAGASLAHPHYQILTLPIIPPDIMHSLEGSRHYFDAHRRCVYCTVLRYEQKKGLRVVAKNAGAIALAPFASRNPYEMRIYPLRHYSYFEDTPRKDIAYCVALLQRVLRRIKTKLQDPDFNFFIHTAPLKRKDQYAHYHWHMEVFPKISTRAGFELSTGVEINIVAPEEAAKFLR